MMYQLLGHLPTCPHCRATLSPGRDGFCWQCRDELPEKVLKKLPVVNPAAESSSSVGDPTASESNPVRPATSESNPVGCLLVLVGAGLIGWFLVVQPGLKAHAAGEWPSTTGTVVRSSFTKTQTVRPSITRYRPVVEYTYTTPGSEYQRTSSAVSADGLIFTSKGSIDDFLATYRPGLNVPVYYNPRDPADTVLVNGNVGHGSVNHWMGYFLVNCGIPLGITGLAALFQVVRRLLRAFGLGEDGAPESK